MHTPSSPEYYLYKDFNGDNSAMGVPFLQWNSSIESGNLIIYGHDMLEGSLFHTLHSYKDKDFQKKHPVIYLDSLTARRNYKVIYAFETDISKDDFLYEDLPKIKKPEIKDFLTKCESRSFLKAEQPKEEGQLLLLSTCSGTSVTKRLVVVAMQIK